MSRKIVILDTETTGTTEKVKNGSYLTVADPEFVVLEKEVEHRITQLAYVVVEEKRGLSILSVEDEMCKPPVESSIGAIATTGITPEMLEDKPSYSELRATHALNELNNEENIMIAHNLPFDNEMLRREGFENKMKLIDTLRVIRHVYPDIERHQMQWFRYGFKLYLKEAEEVRKIGKEVSAHDALGDVIVLKLLVEKLIEDGISIEKQIELTNMPILMTKMRFGKYSGINFDEICKEDPGYILYMFAMEKAKSIDKQDSDFIYTIEHLISKHNLFMQVRFKFGKYKGMYVHEVKNNDIGYLEWLSESITKSIDKGEEVKIPGDIVLAVDFYLDN